jgi:hypothetical protein
MTPNILRGQAQREWVAALQELGATCERCRWELELAEWPTEIEVADDVLAQPLTEIEEEKNNE